MDKTILPGHNFKNPYMTTVIIIVALTIVALSVFWRLVASIKVPGDPVDRELTETELRYGTPHPTSLTGAFFALYIL
jgi:hypothetical protein